MWICIDFQWSHWSLVIALAWVTRPFCIKFVWIFCSLHNICIFWFCFCMFTRHFVTGKLSSTWQISTNVKPLCVSSDLLWSLHQLQSCHTLEKMRGKIEDKNNWEDQTKCALLYLVQTHTSPCFSIKELIMQSSGMLGSICCWKGQLWIKKKNWKTNLDNHCTLLVLVILGLVLCKPGFRATNFSTDIARPRNSLDMGFCVALEVCLQKECLWWADTSYKK